MNMGVLRNWRVQMKEGREQWVESLKNGSLKTFLLTIVGNLRQLRVVLLNQENYISGYFIVLPLVFIKIINNYF